MFEAPWPIRFGNLIGEVPTFELTFVSSSPGHSVEARDEVTELKIGCKVISIRPAENGTVEIRRSKNSGWQQLTPEAAETLADHLRAAAARCRVRLQSKKDAGAPELAQKEEPAP